MTEIQDKVETENISIEHDTPRHIVFEAKTGIYFGKGQIL